MARKSRNRNKQRETRNRSSGPPSQPRSALPKPPVVSPEVDVKEAYAEAMNGATEQDISAVTNDPKPENADVDSLWEIVREARDLFRSARDRYEGHNQEIGRPGLEGR